MAHANDKFQDLLIAQALDVESFSNGMVRRLIALLNEAELDVIDQLRRRGEILGFGDPLVLSTSHKVARLEQLIRDLQSLRGEAYRKVHSQLRSEMREFAKLEAGFTVSALGKAISIVEVQLVLPPPAVLRTLITAQLIRGAFLKEWMAKLSADDGRRLRDTIRLGVIEGQGLDEIVRRVRGTRAQGFRDGILQTSRREAEGIVRTAISFTANAAREAAFIANADVLSGLIWISVLDGRTSPVCQSRDGDVTVLPGGDPSQLPAGSPRLNPPNTRPPAHLGGCRSIMGAIISGIGVVGTRPFITSTATGRQRRINFLADARAKAGDRWRGLTRSQRNVLVAKQRSAWAARNIGIVPGKTTYQEFLARQPAKFQNEKLGRTRGLLFRRGGLDLKDFVDLGGREFTLAELARRHADAFQKAGLL